MFRLIERLQKLDTMLRSAERRRRTDPNGGDPFEIARLRARKLQLRDRLARLRSFPMAVSHGL